VCKNGDKYLATPFGLFLKWYIGLLQGILTHFSLQDGIITGSGKSQDSISKGMRQINTCSIRWLKYTKPN